MSGKREWSGSELSRKQLAHAVEKGRRVTFQTERGEVSGYLGGMDDYHWMVLCPSGTSFSLRFVHKTAPFFEISLDSTYEDEEAHEKMESLVAPFRARMAEMLRGQNHRDPVPTGG